MHGNKPKKETRTFAMHVIFSGRWHIGHYGCDEWNHPHVFFNLAAFQGFALYCTNIVHWVDRYAEPKPVHIIEKHRKLFQLYKILPVSVCDSICVWGQGVTQILNVWKNVIISPHPQLNRFYTTQVMNVHLPWHQQIVNHGDLDPWLCFSEIAL